MPNKEEEEEIVSKPAAPKPRPVGPKPVGAAPVSGAGVSSTPARSRGAAAKPGTPALAPAPAPTRTPEEQERSRRIEERAALLVSQGQPGGYYAGRQASTQIAEEEGWEKQARERIGEVARLRAAKKLGVHEEIVASGAGNVGSYRRAPAEKPIALPRGQRPLIGSRVPRTHGRVDLVRPDPEAVERPTTEELENPYLAAQHAAELVRKYKQANDFYNKGALEIERMTKPQSATEKVDKGALWGKAVSQRMMAKISANIAASLREFGWTDDDLRELGGIGLPEPASE